VVLPEAADARTAGRASDGGAEGGMNDRAMFSKASAADYLDMTRQMVMAFRKANPDKAPTNKAEYAKILAKFGVGNLAEVPKEKSKDFFLAVKEIC
jgi:hypothetical protein